MTSGSVLRHHQREDRHAEPDDVVHGYLEKPIRDSRRASGDRVERGEVDHAREVGQHTRHRCAANREVPQMAMHPTRGLGRAFDLDGTLVDSSGDLADSGNALLPATALRPCRRKPSSQWSATARELVRRLLTAAALDVPLDDALARFLALYDNRLLATTVPYDGMPALLDGLKSHARLAVLTNKPLVPSERILRGLGLREFFDDVIGGDSDFGRKPNPDGLFALMDRAAASAAETLMVGDSVTDLRTARAAGTPVCVARYGFGFAQMPADELQGAAFVVDQPGRDRRRRQPPYGFLTFQNGASLTRSR